jgi:hypothetical protein
MRRTREMPERLGPLGWGDMLFLVVCVLAIAGLWWLTWR